MTRAARITLYRYHLRRRPVFRMHGCETPLAHLLRTSYAAPALSLYIGEPIPLGEQLRGKFFGAGRRTFGVME